MTTAPNKPVTAEELTGYGRAKARVAALVATLKTRRAAAVRLNNAAAVRAIDVKLKEGADLLAKANTLDKLLAPFIGGWQWVKDRVGLAGMGELGAFFVPVLAAGGIGAFVYAVKTWGDNTETFAEQIAAQNTAMQAAIERGEDPRQARAAVVQTAAQFNASQTPVASGGLLEKLVGNKTILLIVAAVLAYFLWTRQRGNA